MKVTMRKLRGGILAPETDMEADKMDRFATDELYEIDIKLSRNYEFHKKVFAFMGYCFVFWQNNNEFQTERVSFDVFRANLCVLAGYKDVYYKIDGSVRVEAKSLSYASMSQDEFEELYKALISAAMMTIFKGCDESHYDKLIGFF